MYFSIKSVYDSSLPVACIVNSMPYILHILEEYETDSIKKTLNWLLLMHEFVVLPLCE